MEQQRAQVCYQCPVLTLAVGFLVLAADMLQAQEGGRETKGKVFSQEDPISSFTSRVPSTIPRAFASTPPASP